MSTRPIRIARVVGRLNIGGPSIHAILLTSRLDGTRFETRLFCGELHEGEVEISSLLREEGVRAVRIPGLGRDLRPSSDARALVELVRQFRAFKPDIVDTHTAKAGALGRAAAVIARVPVRVHTFHGNVFRGYFGPAATAAFLNIERALARLTTRIVVVSEQQRVEIVERFRVAAQDDVTVMRCGIDFSRLQSSGARRDELRRRLGLPEGRPIVLWIGRLVRIKNPLLAVEVAARLVHSGPKPIFAMFGGGPMEAAVRQQVDRRGLGDSFRFGGWLEDVGVAFASADALLLTSDNEGAPFSVIEALGAGVPVVATAVGSVPEMLSSSRFGVTVARGDVGALAASLARVLEDSVLRERVRSTAPDHARQHYGLERLLEEAGELYVRLVRERARPGTT